jgi:transcriptional regulator with XRE-family HTH domain
MLSTEFKAWRTKLGFTQEEVARRFRISRVTVINWENDNSPISEIVEQLCRSYEEHWVQEQRRRPDHGPVKLYCYGSGKAAQPVIFENNENAIEAATNVCGEDSKVEPFITSLDGDDIWNIREMRSEINKRLAANRVSAGREGLAERLMEIGRHFSSLPVYDDRSPDEIIGYDENGLPR